jgi:hypothetical protein
MNTELDKQLKQELQLNDKEYEQLIFNELKERLENDDITVELKNTSWIRFKHDYLDYSECNTIQELLDYAIKELHNWNELEFELYDDNLKYDDNLNPTRDYTLFNLNQAFKAIENDIKDTVRHATGWLVYMQEYEPLKLDHLIAEVKAVV